jgi:FAD/FMN-containing dehydrogenase
LPDDLTCDVRENDIRDERGREGIAPLFTALPRTVEEVSQIVRACAEAGVPVVPRGGGTGLVLGQIATDGPAPVLLSLERMDRVRAVHPKDNILIAEAGCILADVQAAAAEADRLFPLSLAAEGTCRIGGNLATNAGGLNVLRYGNARDLCLGLEAVLPDGSIWHGLKRLRKDNTGYDLKNLLVGSEGTLGIITAASLRLFPRPARRGTALFRVASPQAAVDLLGVAQGMASELISAFELIDATGQQLLSETLPQVRLPFDEIPAWSVLVELGTPSLIDPNDLFEALFEAALEQGLVDDGVIAQSEGQAAELWQMRESIPEANRLTGGIAFHDISLPPSDIPGFLARSEMMLADIAEIRIGAFGHVGDGNLHYNLFPLAGRTKADYADVAADLTRAVHDLVHDFGGSFSAEHGVGRMKVAELERYGDAARLGAMRRIRTALDPNGSMNPGAVLALVPK